MHPRSLVLSCEHAGTKIPDNYKYLFNGHQEVLQSHRGWDPGAHTICGTFNKQLSHPVHLQETSRLLIECNRSLTEEALFSEFSNGLPFKDKMVLIDQIYLPYRNKVEHEIIFHQTLSRPVAHISIHTFTPILNNKRRNYDIGLLFDEGRKQEWQFCEQWKQNILKSAPGLQIEYNKPYKGSDDGFTTYLRKHFQDDIYLGIELEVNHSHCWSPSFIQLCGHLAQGLRPLISKNNKL